MQILEESEAGIAYALEILALGGTVAHATETCYGLACDMTNPDAVDNLFKIKNRPNDQPVSALFPSIEASEEWVEWCDEALELANNELPGPLTVILPIKEDKLESIFPTPQRATSNEQRATLGVRTSPHPVAMALTKQFGKPLSTTSANLSGKPSPYSIEEIQKQLSNNPPDLIIDSGTLEKIPPSRIVMFKNGKMEVVRE